MRGLRTKTKELYDNILANNYDVIVFTETGLSDSYLDAEIVDNRYTLYRQDRNYKEVNKKRGGGVLVAVLNKYESKQLFNNNNSAIECLWIKINLRYESLIVSVVYFPPNSKMDIYAYYWESMEKLETITNSNIVIMGDFNLYEVNGPDYDFTEGSKISKLMCKYMNMYNLRSVNGIVNNTGRTLDLVLTSLDCSVTEDEIPITRVDQLYHPPLNIELDFVRSSKSSVASNMFRYQYNFKKANFNLIYEKLANMDWSCLHRENSVDSMVERLYSILYNILEETVPKVKIRNQINKFPKWYDNHIKNMLKTKLKLFNKMKRSPNNNNLKLRFNNIRKEIKRLISLAHANYINEVEQDIQGDPKKFWTYISNSRKKLNPLNKVSYGTKEYSGHLSIANAFHKYFGSVYVDTNTGAKINVPPTGLGSLHFESVTEEEIRNAIKKLKPKAAVGCDEIPGYIIKGCSEFFIEPLRYIYSLSLHKNVFPKAWKIARIIPIHKGGNKSLVENYRPVSILNAFSKIFENIIFNRIYKHVASVISSYQHGFLPKKSTVTNLLTFSDIIAKNIDSKNQLDVIYLDASKAFDKVNFKILLQKLNAYGLSVGSLNFLESYLTDRKVFVRFNQMDSEMLTPVSGVPQGSVLGPLLFLLLINDLPKNLKECAVSLYADDIKIFKQVKNHQEAALLQQDLDRLVDWYKINGLELNIKKCKVMSFSRKKEIIRYKYKIENNELERVIAIKDLGVWFTSTFKFGMHIEKSIKEAYRNLGWVLRNSKKFSVHTAITLYNTYVRTKLEYATLVWAPQTFVESDSIERVQKKFLRILYYRKFNIFPDFRNHVSYQNQLNIFKVKRLNFRREVSALVFIYKILNSNVDCNQLLGAINIFVPNARLRNKHIVFKTSFSCSPANLALKMANDLVIKLDLDVFHLSLCQILKICDSI